MRRHKYMRDAEPVMELSLRVARPKASLYRAVKQSALKNKRTMNQELTWVLERHYLDKESLFFEEPIPDDFEEFFLVDAPKKPKRRRKRPKKGLKRKKRTAPETDYDLPEITPEDDDIEN
jgi:hypothetical protein